MLNKKNSNQFSRILFLLVFCMGIMLLVSACNSSNEAAVETSTTGVLEYPTVTFPLTPTQLPTETPAPTFTPSPSLTPTPDPNPHVIAGVGRGLIEDYYFSSDGSIVAFLGGDYLKWYDANTGEKLGEVELPDRLREPHFMDLYFSPKNKWIIVKSFIDTQLVDTRSGDLIDCCNYTMKPVSKFRFSSDMKYMAYIINDDSMGRWATWYRYLGIYNFETGEDIILENPYQRVSCILGEPAFHPDNTMVAVGYYEEGDALELIVWDFPSGEIRYHFSYSSYIDSVAFSPDGQYLVTGSEDGYLRFHVPETGEWIRSVSGIPVEISQLRFSEDGTKIFITSYYDSDPEYVYDLASDNLSVVPETTPSNLVLAEKHQEGWADGGVIKFSPVENIIAIGGDSIQLWDFKTKELLVSLENPHIKYISNWSFSPSGDKIAGISDSYLMIWDTANGELILDEFKTDLYRSVAFSPNGSQIAFGRGDAIEIWDLIADEQVVSLISPDLAAYRISFSQDGSRLYAIYDYGRFAKVWDVHTGKLLQSYTISDNDRNTLVLSRNLIANFNRSDEGESTNWFELWDLNTGEIKELSAPEDFNFSMRFSPDGSILIVRGDYKLNIWDAKTGTLLETLDEIDFRGLAINYDNTLFAFGIDGTAQIWDFSMVFESLEE